MLFASPPPCFPGGGLQPVEYFQGKWRSNVPSPKHDSTTWQKHCHTVVQASYFQVRVMLLGETASQMPTFLGLSSSGSPIEKIFSIVFSLSQPTESHHFVVQLSDVLGMGGRDVTVHSTQQTLRKKSQ